MGIFDGVLLDIDGVLVTSWEPLPGARETLGLLRERGLSFLLVTNTTTKSRTSLAEALREAGLEISPDEVVTAPMATATYLRERHPGERVFLLAAGDVGDDLQGVELVEEGADVVVIGGAAEPDPDRPDTTFTLDNLSRALGMLLEGAALVAMHRNLSWRTASGVALDTGALTYGLERAAGVEATVVGKPSEAFFGSVLELLGVPADRTVMVGDDIEADVLGAQSVGITGVLVRTGKFRPQDLERGRPDHVVDSIADLPALLRSPRASGPSGSSSVASPATLLSPTSNRPGCGGHDEPEADRRNQ